MRRDGSFPTCLAKGVGEEVGDEAQTWVSPGKASAQTYAALSLAHQVPMSQSPVGRGCVGLRPSTQSIVVRFQFKIKRLGAGGIGQRQGICLASASLGLTAV